MYFDGIEKGNTPYHVGLGIGTVREIIENLFKVVWEDARYAWFSFDGIWEGEKDQSLFWSKPEFTPPPRPKWKVEKVIEGWLWQDVDKNWRWRQNRIDWPIPESAQPKNISVEVEE